MKIKESGAYRITCLPTCKIYIGSAVNIKARWNGHRYDLRNNTHDNQYLQNAWNKYGEDEFDFDILETVNDINLLHSREQHWMDTLDVFDRSKGFNLAPIAGTTRGYKHSAETVEKYRLCKLGVYSGSKNPKSKLAELYVITIRQEFSNGAARCAVQAIKEERTWKRVQILQGDSNE